MPTASFSRISLEHAIAGSGGTVLATLLLFPLERAKTLLQLDGDRQSGLLTVLLQVLREEGPSGLYRGCPPMLQTVGTSNFIYFFLFEGFKERLAQAAGLDEGEVGPYQTLAAASIAGSLNMAVTEPLWRACVVAQAQHANISDSVASSSSTATTGCCETVVTNQQGVFYTVAQMWRKEGPSALWRGLGSSLWLVLNPVIQFFVYDVLKGMFASSDGISSATASSIGAIAKALATLLTFPLQVAQSRLRNAHKSDRCGDGTKPELLGMVPCLHAILAERGFLALYIGLLPKLIQTVTHAALMFAIYEKLHWAIRRLSRQGVRRLMHRKRESSR